MPRWTAERAVTDDQARSLIEKQFPELCPAIVVRLGEGWDNVAVEVNGEWVFRFPRRTIAVELLETERKVLPVIAPALPLAIPVPAKLGVATEDFPWQFAGYRMLPGKTACRADLDERARVETAERLGEFLAALHAVPAEDARRAGAGTDTLRRFDIPRRREIALEELDKALHAGRINDAKPFRELADSAPTDFRARADTVVHGDLYVRHLIVDSQRTLTGVIDWGDVHIGDPGCDLALVYSFLPPSARSRFCSVYGAISSQREHAARLRALVYGLVLLSYGADVEDQALVREGHLALRYCIA